MAKPPESYTWSNLADQAENTIRFSREARDTLLERLGGTSLLVLANPDPECNSSVWFDPRFDPATASHAQRMLLTIQSRGVENPTMIGMYTERPDRNRLATKLLGPKPTAAVGIIFGETDGSPTVNLNTAIPDRWDTALFTPESYQSLP
ncbi:hypothetical protein KBD11_02105, partial [Candidatus Saccharibacteria bacterium]|nr:hypothetical protein [Candidatus Saccharibacteria bacterium]